MGLRRRRRRNRVVPSSKLKLRVKLRVKLRIEASMEASLCVEASQEIRCRASGDLRVESSGSSDLSGEWRAPEHTRSHSMPCLGHKKQQWTKRRRMGTGCPIIAWGAGIPRRAQTCREPPLSINDIFGPANHDEAPASESAGEPSQTASTSHAAIHIDWAESSSEDEERTDQQAIGGQLWGPELFLAGYSAPAAIGMPITL